MAYTEIDKPSDYFNTKLYTGNGSTQSISGIGFQPDWIWYKRRDATNHNRLIDSVRGSNKNLASDLTNAENTESTYVTSFNSDGWSIGSNTDVNASSSSMVAWTWLASNTTASNTDGSITSTVSANTTSGFSIVSYTGNGSAGATVGHGLGAVPKMLIVKRRNSTGGWVVYHEDVGNTKIIELHDTAASQTSSAAWNNTTPSSTTFTLGDYTSTNTSGGTYIAYCFAEKKGFSKFGKFTGNGSTDGTFVYTGFKPAFVLAKPTDITGNWPLFDNKLRPANNVGNNFMYADLSNAQDSSSDFDMLSNGFKTRTTSNLINGSGNSYIYMCFASNPFVTSTGIPTTAR